MNEEGPTVTELDDEIKSTTGEIIDITATSVNACRDQAHKAFELAETVRDIADKIEQIGKLTAEVAFELSRIGSQVVAIEYGIREVTDETEEDEG